MDQRVVRLAVSSFLTKVDARFGVMRPALGLSDVFFRVVFGENRKTAPGLLDGKPLLGKPLMFASLLIILGKAELSAGRTDDSLSHLSYAMEILELLMERNEPSVKAVYSNGVVMVEALLLLSRVSAFLGNLKMQAAALLKVKNGCFFLLLVSLQQVLSKAVEIYHGLPAKAEVAAKVRESFTLQPEKKRGPPPSLAGLRSREIDSAQNLPSLKSITESLDRSMKSASDSVDNKSLEFSVPDSGSPRKETSSPKTPRQEDADEKPKSLRKQSNIEFVMEGSTKKNIRTNFLRNQLIRRMCIEERCHKASVL